MKADYNQGDDPRASGVRVGKLSKKHRAELRASGIDDAMIERSGIFTANGEIRNILGDPPKGSSSWGEGMVIPFCRLGRDKPDYYRVKLDKPRQRRGGDMIKYESPRGKPNRVYFPPGFAESNRSARQIILTEGEKKALAAQAAGFTCAGLVGVWGWQQKRAQTDGGKKYGRRHLVPDLRAIEWSGREVVLLYDSDAADNPLVRMAESKLAQVLIKEGASVRVARLPGDGDKKVGLDDYIVKHGADALRKIVQDARPAEEPPPPSPMELARMYLEERHTSNQGILLRWWRDQFWEYVGTHYRLVPESELLGFILQWLDRVGIRATPRLASDVMKCLGSEIRVPFNIDQPVHLGSSPQPRPGWIATENGILDLDILLAGQSRPLAPHTPKWFSPMALPYAYDPTAECPEWCNFLYRTFEDDEQRIDLLGELFGYCLTDDTSFQTIAILEGPPRAGKGVVLRALQQVVGSENCVSPRLSTLGETFGLQSLIGKRVALCADAHIGSGDRALSVVESLKLISGEDTTDVQRKHLPAITTRLRVRFVLACNELPRLGDASTALASRVIIIPFRQSFLGKEDITLESKISAEAAGIFLWALDGLARLRKNRAFTKPQLSMQVEADFARLTSPVKAFLDDCCVVASDAESLVRKIFSAWKSWCEEHGHKPCSSDRLGTRLRTLVPKLTIFRGRNASGDRPRSYVGLRLKGAAHK